MLSETSEGSRFQPYRATLLPCGLHQEVQVAKDMRYPMLWSRRHRCPLDTSQSQGGSECTKHRGREPRADSYYSLLCTSHWHPERPCACLYCSDTEETVAAVSLAPIYPHSPQFHGADGGDTASLILYNYCTNTSQG